MKSRQAKLIHLNLTARLQNGFSNYFFEYQIKDINKFVPVYL